MNGSENFYAVASFFVLMSFGAFLKLDEPAGWLGGIICALVAAISFRLALIKSAQAAEEDHQRMEIQIQQLRTKIGESSAINIETMNSLNDAAQSVRENIQVIRIRLAELDNLTQIAEDSRGFHSTVINLDGSYSSINSEIEKLNEIAEANKENLRTILKLLQLIAQLIKNSSYSKDLAKINSSLEILAANEKVR